MTHWRIHECQNFDVLSDFFTSVASFNRDLVIIARVFESYHLHVALQLADAGSLALGGAHVAQVMDGDGGTDAGVQLSDCGGR